MSMLRLALLALFATMSLSAPAWATSGCTICDCNDQQSVCRMQCQQNYSDYAQRLNCEVSCATTYSSCVDTAYQTARSLQQSAQQATSTSSASTSGSTQTTTTTSSGSTASGS